MAGREDYDRKIRADELKKGDRLHLTVMGGDEYFEVTKVEVGKEVFWEAEGVGHVEDHVERDQMVWIKK